jgi:hypothetical protein
MNEHLKDQDVLLVREKGSNELSVAKMDKDGKVKQVKPDSENGSPVKPCVVRCNRVSLHRHCFAALQQTDDASIYMEYARFYG